MNNSVSTDTTSECCVIDNSICTPSEACGCKYEEEILHYYEHCKIAYKRNSKYRPVVTFGNSHSNSSELYEPQYKIDYSQFYRFIPLQKWKGIVFEVCEETFWARLYDLSEDNPPEEAEILIRDLSDEDIEFLDEGATFYFNIGYSVSPQGQKQRISVIRMKRVSNWTADEIIDANKIAQEKSKHLIFD